MTRGPITTYLGVVVAVVAAGAVSFIAPARATEAAHWQSSAHTTGISTVTWLSCTAPHQCTAFGETSTDAEVSGVWAPATSISGLPAGSRITAITCPAPTTCVVGGTSAGQSFLLDETSGVWGTAHLIAGTAPYVVGSETEYADYTSTITEISCRSTTQCVAAGNYSIELEPALQITYAGPAFSATLSSGSWSAATSVTGVDAVTGLSCSNTTTCTLVGYQTTFQLFEVYPIVTNVAVTDTMSRGQWAGGADVAGLTRLGRKRGWIDSQVTSLSCVSAGNCTLGGNDEYAPDFDGNPVSASNAVFHGFVAREVSGVWGTATELAALSGVPFLACSSTLHCVAADASDVNLENLGRWGTSRTITVSRHALTIGAVACALRGSCLAAGAGASAAYAILASGGMWTAPQRLATLATVGAASCPATGACVVAGGPRVISQS